MAAALARAHPAVEVVEVPLRTTGDSDRSTPLHEQGSVGLFTRELERALLAREIDLAVHSLKDLPTQLPEGLCIAAVPERASPWDVWISEDYADPRDLPEDACVLTGSLRRSAQLLHRFPGVEVRGIRGNIETRLARYRELGGDGLVLAAAGLARTGREALIRATLGPTEMTPAPGQGALGLETRAGDRDTIDAAIRIDDARARAEVTAERALLSHLDAGCHMPVGAIARVNGPVLSILGMVALPDGSRLLRMATEGDCGEPEEVGAELARRMLHAGAAEILAATRKGVAP